MSSKVVFKAEHARIAIGRAWDDGRPTFRYFVMDGTLEDPRVAFTSHDVSSAFEAMRRLSINARGYRFLRDENDQPVLTLLFYRSTITSAPAKHFSLDKLRAI